ncbi:phosphatase PAP2 family protein [Mucilaginibacter myungsuensis]|uniref:Phosphatase PAP2 family protein n=1 Tax=Mucilaginibacter myungsuensis TaxID=649104 RepID=A0A929KW73_9SPHI|nr:phosphatase PAP2 family protein [Mucilaginibacter myungsuensis]MBE9662739.1 phosphatase PAP2 family protein [Mucilaginibacter myungsuensis]MDN3598159.1 phosphatase PAP2 family protein [Mucilaginibacter myungsuensis]
MRKIAPALLLCIFAFGAKAQVTDTPKVNIIDTIKKDLLTAPDTVPHLRSKLLSLVPPTLLIGYGVTSFYVKPIRNIDFWVRDQADDYQIVPNSRFENIVQYAPLAFTYGLNLAGVRGKHTFVDRTLVLAMAMGLNKVATSITKQGTNRMRPNGTDDFSFPSGHTSKAFVAAEFMAQEMGDVSPWYTVLGYSCATFTAMSRVSHKDHWFSDVIAGAGVGILSTKGAYLIYPYLRKLVVPKKEYKERREEKKFYPPDIPKKQRKSATFLPTYGNGTVGFAFVAEL